MAKWTFGGKSIHENHMRQLRTALMLMYAYNR